VIARQRQRIIEDWKTKTEDWKNKE